MILLNPGPVTLSEGVRRALSAPDLCHREAEFFDLQDRVRAGLLAVYGLAPGDWAAVVLGGSGTAAVEAMIASLVGHGGRILVAENGVYGERMSALARAHGVETEALHHDWGAALDTGRLAQALDRARPSHLAVVHHETTTGRLNDLAPIAALCRQRGVHLLVDAVASFGAEALDLDGWGISACALAPNKCLHGAPGLGIVCVRRRDLRAVAGLRRTLALDLATHLEAQDRRDTAFTPAIPLWYALDAALTELARTGGWTARRERYRLLAGRVAQGLGALGVRPLLPHEASSVVLRAYRLPQGVSYRRLHDGLKARGFVIYAGQGGLARRIFRISTMGAISESDIDRLIGAVRTVLAQGEG